MEGEALTGAGNDLVDSVSMPAPISDLVDRFIAGASRRAAVFQAPGGIALANERF